MLDSYSADSSECCFGPFPFSSSRGLSMARANVASVALRVPRVMGLAKTLVCPSYRRLLHMEPMLHRMVPVLIGIFLATLGTAGFMQIMESRERVIGQAKTNLDIVVG